MLSRCSPPGRRAAVPLDRQPTEGGRAALTAEPPGRSARRGRVAGTDHQRIAAAGAGSLTGPKIIPSPRRRGGRNRAARAKPHPPDERRAGRLTTDLTRDAADRRGRPVGPTRRADPIRPRVRNRVSRHGRLGHSSATVPRTRELNDPLTCQKEGLLLDGVAPPRPGLDPVGRPAATRRQAATPLRHWAARILRASPTPPHANTLARRANAIHTKTGRAGHPPTALQRRGFQFP